MTEPCKWCGIPNNNTVTKECDRCWELRHRIEDNIDIAIQILIDNPEVKCPECNEGTLTVNCSVCDGNSK